MEAPVKKTYLAGGVFVVKAYADNYPEVIDEITEPMDFEEAAQLVSEATGQGLSTVRARTLAHLRAYLLERYQVIELAKAVRWVHTYEPRVAAWMLLKGAKDALSSNKFPEISDFLMVELAVSCTHALRMIEEDHRLFYGDKELVYIEKNIKRLGSFLRSGLNGSTGPWYAHVVTNGLKSLINDPILKRPESWKCLQVPLNLELFVDPLPNYPVYTDTISENEAKLLEARLKELGFGDEENV